MVSDLIVSLNKMSINTQTLTKEFSAFTSAKNFKELKILYQAKTTKHSNTNFQIDIGKKNQNKMKKVLKPKACETSRYEKFSKKNSKLYNSFRNKELSLKQQYPMKGTYHPYTHNYSEYRPYQPTNSRF